MKHTEDREHIALVTWLRAMERIHPDLGLAYHTPNGGYRDARQAAKFKAMGVRAGIWDIFVPVPAPGLWVEMKAPGGRLTPGQREWRERLEPAGYRFEVAFSWVEAARYIASHVGFEADL